MAYNVTFRGGETAGSIAKIYSGGGETAGSIGKLNGDNPPRTENPTPIPDYPPDTVSFRGNGDYEEKKKSPLFKIALFATAIAGVIGGLGIAHQKKWIDKIGNDTMKKYANKVCEPCHNWCSSVKKFGVENYKKIKDWFGKKK